MNNKIRNRIRINIKDMTISQIEECLGFIENNDAKNMNITLLDIHTNLLIELILRGKERIK